MKLITGFKMQSTRIIEINMHRCHFEPHSNVNGYPIKNIWGGGVPEKICMKRCCRNNNNSLGGAKQCITLCAFQEELKYVVGGIKAN